MAKKTISKAPVKKTTQVKKTTKKAPAKRRIKSVKSIYEKYPELKTVVANLALNGDISELSSPQRVMYYNAYCESLGLNPLTKPFDILVLKGKTVMYANKECAAQLRELKGVNIDAIHTEQQGDMYIVIVKGHDKSGKTDCDLAAVTTKNLQGESLCNAMMKATTKAKRRLTLSLCGLGSLDETEIESIKSMEQKDVEPVDYTNDNLTYTKSESTKEPQQQDNESQKNTFKKIISFVNDHQKDIHKTPYKNGSEIIIKAKNMSESEQDIFLKELEDVIHGK
jgi:hypothetical protein